MSADVWEEVLKGTGTALIIRGAAAVLFAALVILWPDATVLALVLLFGIFALIDGAVAVADLVRRRRRRSVWALAGGLVSVAAGVVSLFWPGITALALALVIGFWAVLFGAAQTGVAFQIRKIRRSWWLWLAAGVLTVLFGLNLLLFPGHGILGVLGLLSACAAVLGLLLIAAGLQLRSVRGAWEP